jgi:hypothetical protein
MALLIFRKRLYQTHQWDAYQDLETLEQCCPHIMVQWVKNNVLYGQHGNCGLFMFLNT